MRAICLGCSRVVPGRYEFSDDAVDLTRQCEVCGATTSTVSHDPDFFELSLAGTSGDGSAPAGVIVELLDGCNISCPTCIADSSPSRANLRDPRRVHELLNKVIQRDSVKAVYLSGGEPTIHPRLFDFIEVVEQLPVDRRILITNGIRIADDEEFRNRLLTRLADRWEVFLQFDSLDADALIDLRGDDYSAVRVAAVDALNEYMVPTTLVAVAKRGITLHDVPRVVDYALKQEAVVGVQFQPIRDAGRVLNYDPARNVCTASDVISVLKQWQPRMEFVAHPLNPLSVSLAYARKGRMGVKWEKAPGRLTPADFYLEPSSRPNGRFRVSVVEYSDETNWTSVRSSHSPLSVLQPDGSTTSVDDHFLDMIDQASGM